MVDTISKARRSEVMALVKSKNTKPEIVVRSFLHGSGFRFRLHDKRLPGKPDLVFPKYNVALFVHGCFWHGHQSCPHHRIPKSNVEFWENKISGNQARDQKHQEALKALGWRVIVVWECEIRKIEFLEALASIILGRKALS
jgi:DNA mismatch endonuclease (patch repair protein)